MAKVTSKLQVTIPKAIADRYHIRPGDEIAWREAGDAIHVVPAPVASADAVPTAERLQLFDRATDRQRARESGRKSSSRKQARGWTREELYRRGGAR